MLATCIIVLLTIGSIFAQGQAAKAKIWALRSGEPSIQSESLTLNEIIVGARDLEKRLGSFADKLSLIGEVKKGGKVPRDLTAQQFVAQLKSDVDFSKENMVLIARGPAEGLTMTVSNVKVTKNDINVEIKITQVNINYLKPPAKSYFFFVIAVPKGSKTLKCTEVRG